MNRVVLRVRRKDHPETTPYVETYLMDLEEDATLLDALRKTYFVPQGAEPVTGVVYSSGCHEGLCGRCAVEVNGEVKLACQTKLGESSLSFKIEPLPGFKVLRDLLIDHDRIENDLEKFESWTHSHFLRTDLSGCFSAFSDVAQTDTCTECGICISVCPSASGGNFSGAAVIFKSQILGQTESVDHGRKRRNALLLGERGIAGCEDSGECVRACPQKIDLVTWLSRAKKAAMKALF